MKAIILGGFLGSGKTTVLLRMVPWLVKKYEGGKSSCPVVVLENEISLTDVDARRLRDNGFTVRNLTAGCICCTSQGELMGTVKKIVEEYAPDCLVVEATGMAYPDSIKETLQRVPEVDSVKIVGIVDTGRWKKLVFAMPDFVRGQLCQADVILMNKIDQTDPELLAEVEMSIREYAKTESIYSVAAREQIPEFCFEGLL